MKNVSEAESSITYQAPEENCCPEGETDHQPVWFGDVRLGAGEDTSGSN